MRARSYLQCTMGYGNSILWVFQVNWLACYYSANLEWRTSHMKNLAVRCTTRVYDGFLGEFSACLLHGSQRSSGRSQWGSPSASDPRAKNTGQRATKGTVLTSQSLPPWCDCRRLGSTLASWHWQDITSEIRSDGEPHCDVTIPIGARAPSGKPLASMGDNYCITVSLHDSDCHLAAITELCTCIFMHFFWFLFSSCDVGLNCYKRRDKCPLQTGRRY